MNLASNGVIDVLTFLLPGFVAAAIFYSLTSHAKPGAFERVIQALIFTMIIKAIVTLYVMFSSSTGESRHWVGDWEPVPSVAIAVILALVAAYVLNNDLVHRVLRRLSITRETSYPTEWYSSFSKPMNYIVLHLKGERRLYGWPEEWPSRPEEGHFRIVEGEWLTEKGSTPATGVASIVIPVSEVEMVEFLEKYRIAAKEAHHG